MLQNALASVLASWRRLRDVSDLDAYVYTAMVNARSRWWRRRWHGEVPFEVLPESTAAQPARSDDAAGRYDTHDALITALREIPDRQRAAIVLRYYEELTEEETAQVLGCSVGTVKSQTSRGLVRLRAALADPAHPSPRATGARSRGGHP